MSQLFKLEGKVHEIGTQMLKTGKTKTTVVVEVADKYKGQTYYDYLPIQFFADNAPQGLRKGLPVKATFRVSGREWQGRYYTDLRGVAMEPLAPADDEQGQGEGSPAFPEQDATTEGDDGMPF